MVKGSRKSDHVTKTSLGLPKDYDLACKVLKGDQVQDLVKKVIKNPTSLESKIISFELTMIFRRYFGKKRQHFTIEMCQF